MAIWALVTAPLLQPGYSIKMKQIKTLIIVFALWTCVGLSGKVFFLLFYHSIMPSLGGLDCLSVLWYGLRLDVSIAGYFSLVPGLMLIAAAWYGGRVLKWIWHIYFAIMSVISSVAYVSNIGLYAYWGFPLDSTPLLYIRTSPSAALASMAVWQILVLFIVIVGVALGIYKAFERVGRRVSSSVIPSLAPRSYTSIVLLMLTGLMIIPIRGGFGTGTNHTGSVYFSSDIRMNHAAVNPIFSFMESVMHKEEISTRYRFMEGDKADRIFSTMICTRLRPDASRHDYNVVLVCLESFSKYIMAEAGHVSGVVPNLDRYSHEGIYFTDFYANSFRTDRALVSVLSGLPAQPTMSVMDQPRISTALPSIARTLGRNGYGTHFYYGGDTNYSNMRSYIVGTGFQQVTSQYDFSAKQNTGKWGVADGPVYDRILNDIKREGRQKGKPFFKVFMTSSSHEPFDVPDYKKMESPELNAFSYADHCLGLFIERLKKMPCWKNTLVVIVPDHLGVYPPQLDNYQLWRYEIPLIMLGGMVGQPQQVPTVGSQIDISATVLGMLGLQHEDFMYSKDLFDTSSPHFAFFSFPDAMGIVEGNGFLCYDNTSKKVVAAENGSVTVLLSKTQAYLQKLYDGLGQLGIGHGNPDVIEKRKK